MSLDRFCRIENNQIIVEGNGVSQELTFCQCDTHEKILAWTAYFLERPAYDPAVILRFIRLAAQQHDLLVLLA